MTVTFRYNGKQYTTNNLEKKLTKLGITKDDIELLGNQHKKVEMEEINKRKVIVRSTQDDIRRICFVDEPLPSISELFKDQIWNPETKTGIKYLTKDFLTTMYYE